MIEHSQEELLMFSYLALDDLANIILLNSPLQSDKVKAMKAKELAELIQIEIGDE